jgi:hypothetical protein
MNGLLDVSLCVVWDQIFHRDSFVMNKDLTHKKNGTQKIAYSGFFC